MTARRVEVVVPDASLAIKWVLEEPLTQPARSLLIEWERHGVARLVPVLFLSEVNTPVLKLRRQSLISATEAGQALTALSLAVTVVPEDATLSRRAFAIADELEQRTAHDALYLALAEREGCELWTADERFYRVARNRFRSVQLLITTFNAPDHGLR